MEKLRKLHVQMYLNFGRPRINLLQLQLITFTYSINFITEKKLKETTSVASISFHCYDDATANLLLATVLHMYNLIVLKSLAFRYIAL